MKMSKMKAAAVAVMCCSGLFLNSCMYEVPVYGGVSYNNGYGGVSVSAWTDASYDANGFPIYGYYYGRPVYGYTAEGVAIFTFAALTAACFVPHWDPAPWYHGHWHYPHHIHRVNVPHHCPHDHRPAQRPHGGLNAPIHKNPQSVLRANHHAAPAPQHNNRAPQVNRMDFRNRADNKRQSNLQPGVGRLEHQRNRMSKLPVFDPQQHKGNRPDARPAESASLFNHDAAPNRAPQQHHANRAPQMNAAAPAAPAAPQMHRPSAPAAPAVSHGSHHSAPAAPSMPQVSRPSAPSLGGHSFGGHRSGNHGGGHRR